MASWDGSNSHLGVAMSGSTELLMRSYRYNASASNSVQTFLRGFGTFAFTNFVKMSALFKNTCTFFIFFFET